MTSTTDGGTGRFEVARLRGDVVVVVVVSSKVHTSVQTLLRPASHHIVYSEAGDRPSGLYFICFSPPGGIHTPWIHRTSALGSSSI